MFYPEISSGAIVRFRMANVVCPESEIILKKTTGCLELTGRVVLLSDAGEKSNYYAVVEVKGIATPLVVPVKEVELTHDAASERIAEYSGE